MCDLGFVFGQIILFTRLLRPLSLSSPIFFYSTGASARMNPRSRAPENASSFPGFFMIFPYAKLFSLFLSFLREIFLPRSSRPETS